MFNCTRLAKGRRGPCLCSRGAPKVLYWSAERDPANGVPLQSPHIRQILAGSDAAVVNQGARFQVITPLATSFRDEYHLVCICKRGLAQYDDKHDDQDRCGANGSQNALLQSGLIVFVCCTARENPEGAEGPSFRWCRYSVRPSILHISCSSRVSVKSLLPWIRGVTYPTFSKVTSLCINLCINLLMLRTCSTSAKIWPSLFG